LPELWRDGRWRFSNLQRVGGRRPCKSPGVCTITGQLGFELAPLGLPAISDTYLLRLEIPLHAPDTLLRVFEDGSRLRRDPDEHINKDGSFCLGSPLRLSLLQRESTGLVGFLESCLVPFLYAASWRSQGNLGFPFKELSHYGPGLTEDYGALLGVRGHRQVTAAIELLVVKKRVANKCPCPCGNGKRFGKCTCYFRINTLRAIAARCFWRRTLREYINCNFENSD